eukprot:12489021-Prorocentrum_lima.AAC.1
MAATYKFTVVAKGENSCNMKVHGGENMCLFVSLLLQDIFSLPLGPVQVGTWWYALARLGISTMAISVWGHTVDGEPYDVW